jgi:hypothetical protein
MVRNHQRAALFAIVALAGAHAVSAKTWWDKGATSAPSPTPLREEEEQYWETLLQSMKPSAKPSAKPGPNPTPKVCFVAQTVVYGW